MAGSAGTTPYGGASAVGSYGSMAAPTPLNPVANAGPYAPRTPSGPGGYRPSGIAQPVGTLVVTVATVRDLYWEIRSSTWFVIDVQVVMQWLHQCRTFSHLKIGLKVAGMTHPQCDPSSRLATG